MAVVDYKNAVEYNGTIPKNLNLETVSYKVLLIYNKITNCYSKEFGK
jgi:hypothetical protein